jgi:hypothetical protein
MRLQKYLQEKYLATYRGKEDEWSVASLGNRLGEKYLEVYINPSSPEVKNLVKSSGIRKFRFLSVPSEKNLIIWPYPAAIHYTMFKWLQKKGYIKPARGPSGRMPIGTLPYIEGFITADANGRMEIDEPAEGQSWVNYNFRISVDYLKKYISNYDEWMDEVEKEYHHYGYEGEFQK